jgi:hypothetical protein
VGREDRDKSAAIGIGKGADEVDAHEIEVAHRLGAGLSNAWI